MNRVDAHRKKVTEDGLRNLKYALEGGGPQTRPLYTWLHVRLNGRLQCINTAHRIGGETLQPCDAVLHTALRAAFDLDAMAILSLGYCPFGALLRLY